MAFKAVRKNRSGFHSRVSSNFQRGLASNTGQKMSSTLWGKFSQFISVDIKYQHGRVKAIFIIFKKSQF